MFKIDEEGMEDPREREDQDGQDVDVGARSPYLERHVRERDDDRNSSLCIANARKSSEEKHYEWNHEEIVQLVEYWAIEDCLYNMRNADYKDKNERANALLRIQKKFEESGVVISVKDIATKMHGLRVYYGATRNKLEAMKKRSPHGAVGNPKVKWIYFESLNFLQDFFHPREKSSNISHNVNTNHIQNSDEARTSPPRKRRKDAASPPENIDSKEDIAVDAMISELPYPLEKDNRETNFYHGVSIHRVHARDATVSETPPPLPPLEGKHIDDNTRSNVRNDTYVKDATLLNTSPWSFVPNYNADNRVPSMSDHTDISRAAIHRQKDTLSRQKDTPCRTFSDERQVTHHDHLFCDMLAGQLQAIPDGESKELLKYEIYGLVLRKRFMQRSGF